MELQWLGYVWKASSGNVSDGFAQLTSVTSQFIVVQCNNTSVDQPLARMPGVARVKIKFDILPKEKNYSKNALDDTWVSQQDELERNFSLDKMGRRLCSVNWREKLVPRFLVRCYSCYG
jgi:hypothetical protein